MGITFVDFYTTFTWQNDWHDYSFFFFVVRLSFVTCRKEFFIEQKKTEDYRWGDKINTNLFPLTIKSVSNDEICIIMPKNHHPETWKQKVRVKWGEKKEENEKVS